MATRKTVPAEQLRLAILAAAHEGDLDLMHKLTVAYHRATGHEQNDQTAQERLTSQRRASQNSAENVCGND